MKVRLNSRQRRRNRCGYKGEGSHKWVKTTPFGMRFREEPDPVMKCAIRHAENLFISKHQGSKKNLHLYTH